MSQSRYSNMKKEMRQMVNNDEIETAKAKYPFLEEILEQSDRSIFKIEEGSIQGVLRCQPAGHHCDSGEETIWQWYGINGKKISPLTGTSIGDALSKKKFDYVVSVDDINAEAFSDRTISIYRVVSERYDYVSPGSALALHKMATADMDHCIKRYHADGLVIAGAKDLAYARMNEKGISPVHNGSWAGEGIIYATDGSALLVSARANPRIKNEKLHRFEAYENKGFVNNLRIDPQSMDAIMTMEKNDRTKEPQHKRVLEISSFEGTMPTKDFGTDELPLFLFREHAKDYGNSLNEKGIESMPFFLPETYLGIDDGPMEALVGAIMGIDHASVGKNKENRPYMDMLWISYDNSHWKSRVIKSFRDGGFPCFYGVRGEENESNQ
jgi:hypothetical protein